MKLKEGLIPFLSCVINNAFYKCMSPKFLSFLKRFCVNDFYLSRFKEEISRYESIVTIHFD